MTESKQEVVEKVRPLTIAQTKNLTKIIENDFGNLRNDISTFAAEKKANAEREIKARYGDQRGDEFAEEMRVLQREYADKQRLLIERAEREGFRFSSYSAISATALVQMTNERLKRELEFSKAEIEQEKRRALARIARTQSDAEREVLVASITGDAEKLLNSLPTAAQLLAQMSQEREIE